MQDIVKNDPEGQTDDFAVLQMVSENEQRHEILPVFAVMEHSSIG